MVQKGSQDLVHNSFIAKSHKGTVTMVGSLNCLAPQMERATRECFPIETLSIRVWHADSFSCRNSSTENHIWTMYATSFSIQEASWSCHYQQRLLYKALNKFQEFNTFPLSSHFIIHNLISEIICFVLFVWMDFLGYQPNIWWKCFGSGSC